MKLKDKVAIITGAARGIGLACAERFHAEGARSWRSPTSMMRPAKAVAARFPGAAYIHCDVGATADVNAMVASVVARFGSIDILINNAGIVVGRRLPRNLRSRFRQGLARQSQGRLPGGAGLRAPDGESR